MWPNRPADQATSPEPSGSPETTPPPVVPAWPGYRPADGGADHPAGGPWRVVEPRRPRIGLSIALIAVLLVSFFSGVAVDRAAITTAPAAATPGTGVGNASASPDFKTLDEALKVLQDHYVDQSALDSKSLEYGATRGLVDAVGDTGHTRFLTPAEVTASHQSLSGSITGIGARMAQVGAQFVIQSVIPTSPAEKAGLRAGDSVLAVDGKAVDGETLDQVVTSIRGDPGTSVRIQIGRSGQDPFEVTIVRATISVPAVSWSLVPGTKLADVRIEEFSKGVSDDLKSALIDAGKAGATGVILDLRDNPGGFVDEAIGVASVFLPSGTVYQERDASGTTKAVPVQAGARATNLPLAVLVNLGSASASEIVAGAIQDAGRARLYGETTFGTGTVLSEFDLSDGSALLVGTVEWLTPNGRQIWHHGITPNVTVALPSGAHVIVPDDMTKTPAPSISSTTDAQLAAAVAGFGGA